MKYNININQFAAQNCGLLLSLDIADLALFDGLKSIANSERCIKKADELGKIWFWVSYKLLIEDLPILGFKTNDSVYRRMTRLRDAGIILFHPDNQKTGKTFFSWGAMYDNLETSKPTPSGVSSVPPPEFHPYPSGVSSVPPPEFHPYNYNTNYYNTNNSESEGEKNSHPQPENEPLQFEAEKKQEQKSAPGAAAAKEPRDLLLDWSNAQLPTIQSWYERAYRKFTQQDLESRVDDFLAVYGTHENYGIRVQVEQDPLKFFRGRFQLFLKNQDKFERPKQGEKAKSRILDTPNRNYEREPLF